MGRRGRFKPWKPGKDWKRRAKVEARKEPEVFEKARAFSPHAFNSRIGGRMPVIYFTPRALNDMWILVDEVTDEVGWLASVKMVDGGFLVDEVYLTNQKVTGTSTELDEDGMADLTMKLLSQPDGMAKANSIRFWGHSHVDMETNPSWQDDRQMEDFAQSGSEFFIRAIFNKKGRIRCDIFFYKIGLPLYDVPWSILSAHDETRRAALRAEIARKVKQEPAYSYLGNIGHGVNATPAVHGAESTIDQVDPKDPLWETPDEGAEGSSDTPVDSVLEREDMHVVSIPRKRRPA